MNINDFNALLDRRDALERLHAQSCAEVNERGGEYAAKRRDQVWYELQQVQARIDAELVPKWRAGL